MLLVRANLKNEKKKIYVNIIYPHKCNNHYHSINVSALFLINYIPWHETAANIANTANKTITICCTENYKISNKFLKLINISIHCPILTKIILSIFEWYFLHEYCWVLTFSIHFYSKIEMRTVLQWSCCIILLESSKCISRRKMLFLIMNTLFPA